MCILCVKACIKNNAFPSAAGKPGAVVVNH